MARKAPQLAKLTRPRLHRAVARERLFAKLDDARKHKPAICVVGPPGAGKTTLVASWLDARGIKGIWYQVDAGDADLATFFYYLGLAAKPFTRKGQRALPLLTPEYLHDVEGFARRFFRELFTRLPAGTVLVLDNYQEIAPEHLFHQILAQAAGEAGRGVTLVAISRRDPPATYARLIANENVQLLQWNDIKLTFAEAQEIVAERAAVDPKTLRLLYDRSAGWAAGLTLMLEQPEQTGRPLEDMSRVFDYFAEQIFLRASPETQRFLMQTALLPNIPVSVANSLTENSAAREILEDLYRRHLFTHRRPGGEPTYWYHALFRDFLREQAARRIPAADRAASAHRAATLLAASGAREEAFGLNCEAGSWEAAAQLTLDCAEQLNASGRGQTVREWIAALPGSLKESLPWLRYWLGIATMPIGLPESRVELEQAFDCFRRLDDHAGQLRAAASVINTYFLEWSHWQPIDRWIDALERLMTRTDPFASLSIEFEVRCAMLIATLYRKPGHRLLAESAIRVEEMLDAKLDLTQVAIGASMLLTYSAVANQPETGRRILARYQNLLHNDALPPLLRVWWSARMTRFLCDSGAFACVESIARTGLSLIEQSGMKGVRSAWGMLVGHTCWALIGMGQLTRAESLVRLLESNSASLRPSDKIIAQEWRIVLSLHRNDFVRALEGGAAAVAGSANAGMYYWELLQRVNLMVALAETGRIAEMHEQAAICDGIYRNTCLQYFEPEVIIIEAYALLRQGDSVPAAAMLRSGFKRAHELNANWRYTRFCGRMMSAVCAAAIEHEIEVPYVKSLILRFELDPGPGAPRAWPWPVRIRTLGRFEIAREDKPLAFRGKAPRRVLALLKVIVAQGSVDVPVQHIIDLLWPESEGDAGYDAFTVTLGRLRKLLGSPSSILIAADRVSLNTKVCFVDAEVFAAFCRQSSDEKLDPASARMMLDLYGGPFLQEEIDAPWALTRRLRLQEQFMAQLERFAKHLEESGRWDDALHYYESALFADQLAESFYQGLMRCHLALKRPAEGLSVYRKLRHTLSIVLGIEPSASSQLLAQRLGGLAKSA